MPFGKDFQQTQGGHVAGHWISPFTGQSHDITNGPGDLTPQEREVLNAEYMAWEKDHNSHTSVDFDPGKALGTVPQQVNNNAPGATLDTTAADAQRADTASLMAQLQQQAATGNGSWEGALHAATQKSQNTAQALGQSEANNGGDYQSALRNIGNAQSAAGQRAVGQGNILRSESQLSAQDQLGELQGAMGQSDIEQANAAARVKQQQGATNMALIDQAAQTANSVKQGISQAIKISDGGEVPGKPIVFGDDEANDIVPAKLSPGEVVLPRTIAHDPEAAADFVRALNARGTGGRKGGVRHMADGGDTGIGYADTNTYGAGNEALSILLPTVGQAVGFNNLRRAAAAGPPSIQNGGLLDTSQFSKTGGIRGSLEGMLAQRANGAGPSIAGQQSTDANDEAIARAMAGRGGVGAVMGATQMAQQGAGNAARTKAEEQQRGQRSLGAVTTQGRAQEMSMAEAQQQAAWNNTMQNLGLSLQNQAALRNMFAGAGQAATAAAGMGGHGDDGRGGGGDEFGDTSPMQDNDLGGGSMEPAGPGGGDTVGDTSPMQDNDLGGGSMAFGGLVGGYADGGDVMEVPDAAEMRRIVKAKAWARDDEEETGHHASEAELAHRVAKRRDAPASAQPGTAQRLSDFARSLTTSASGVYHATSSGGGERQGTAAGAGAHLRSAPKQRAPSSDAPGMDELAVQRAFGGSIPGYAEGGGVSDAGGYGEYNPYALPERRDTGPVVYMSPTPVPGTQPVALGGAGGGAPDVGMAGAGGAGGATEATRYDRGSGGATGGPSDNQTPQHEAIQPRAQRPSAELALPPGVKSPGMTAASLPPAAAPAKPAARAVGVGLAVPRPEDLSGVDREKEAAINEQTRLEAEQARAEHIGVQEQEKVRAAYAIQEKQAQEHANQMATDAMTKWTAAQEEFNRIDTTVDPGRYWASRTTGQKVLGIIGLALGAAGTGPDGVNKAAQMMNQAIDRDIDAQKSETEARIKKGGQRVASAQTFYGMAREIGTSEVTATKLAKAAALDATAARTEMTISAIKEPLAKARGMALIASQHAAAADLREKGRREMVDEHYKQAQLGLESQRLGIEMERAGKAGGLTPERQKAVDDVETATRNIRDNLARAREIIRRKGTFELRGPDQAELQRALSLIATDSARLKDPGSTVREGELAAAKKEIGVEGGEMVFPSNDTALKLLDSFEQTVEQRRKNALQVRGIQ